MKNSRRLLSFLVLLFFSIFTSLALAQAPGIPRCNDTFERTLTNSRVRKSLEGAETIQDRLFQSGGDSYLNSFGSGLRDLLLSFDAQRVWGDFGFGTGHGVLEFLIRHPRLGFSISEIVNIFGITLARPELRGRLWIDADRKFQEARLFTPLVGKMLEDIEPSEIPHYDVGTDLFGPGAYTDRPTQVFNLYLDKMRAPKESWMYTRGLGLYFKSTRGPTERLSGQTFVLTNTGEAISIPIWLRSQDGVIVQHLPDLRAADRKVEFAFRFAKTRDKVILPELVELYFDESTFPPTRIYRQADTKIELNEGFLFESFSGEKIRLTDLLKKPL